MNPEDTHDTESAAPAPGHTPAAGSALPDASDVNGRAALLARAEQVIAGLTDVLADLVADFTDRGHPLHLVGGSVRDAILGRLGNDLDFTTPARPEVVKEILDAHAGVVWDTGIAFGTVSAQMRGQQIEITTFRSDTYDGTSRNPEVRFGDTLDGDLIRRDFKVNAMAVELVAGDDGRLTGRFHDPVGGLDDLLHRRLDTPDTPESSFNDDPLRMLRAARFVSQLGFGVADRVKTAMTEMAGQITRITAERVQVELDKLMAGPAPWTGVNLLVDTGLAGHVFPEIPAMRLTQDEHMQHKDVYAHSMQVLRQAMEQEEDGPDLVLRWAALLHDCGKPATRAFKPGGGVTFHHHEVVGSKLVRKRLRALKYPKQVVSDVSQLVYLHMRFHGFGEGQWTDSAVRRYVTDAGELLPRLHKLVRADSTTRNKKKAARLQRTYDHLEERIDEIAAKEDLARVRPDLDGNEIMEILDLRPGPEVGRAWAFLKELRLERGPLDRAEAVAELRAWWDSEQSSPDADTTGTGDTGADEVRE
ncbi:CCA tRNA nucleotidyltransferase [Corynebacterium halotolerans]|uniref:tRNA nucleotidyltransferase n=1 Tax=Corynebacterium halotolerans YIM 70093 = DSM 44683 TaxID=1121362 RepID=M1NQY8_9CORY|nr:CCA tRNA nucleotidyltransferase [Corynebacterium halotolerans]AGF73793.1 tRNA nucleotidyltransferase [Corynebacterium halotolerans YIM 70093 = DSM 44683]